MRRQSAGCRNVSGVFCARKPERMRWQAYPALSDWRCLFEKSAPIQTPEDVHIQEFLDMIAPSVIRFEKDHFICGNTYCCVWALREYPASTDEQTIFSCLGEKDGVTLRIYTHYLTEDSLISEMSKFEAEESKKVSTVELVSKWYNAVGYGTCLA